jgi:3-hydroxy-9,10-secoandrosta-1,3,5(10)-triene-9,17-dione monooxygenase
MNLVDEARRVAPEITAGATEGESLRRLPDSTWQTLQDSGFLRALQPKRWGGGEVHIGEYAESIVELSRAWGSAGWVAGVIGVHPWQLALFDERAQDEMWGENPATMHSSSYAPVGKVQPAPGGYRLSGRWSFSSGCDHCHGVNLGAIAGMRELGPVTVPDFRSFLLHPGQYTIIDTWHTAGAKATGSKDIVVDDVFVPDYRTQSHVDYFFDLPLPGWERNDGPLYRLPWSVVFNFALAASVVGTALGYVDAWTALASERVLTNMTPARDDALMQDRLASAAYDIDAARAIMRADLNEMWTTAETGQALPRDRRGEMRWHANHGVAIIGRAVNELHHAASGRSIFSDHALQRGFQDMQGFLGHTFLVADDIGREVGALRMHGQMVGAML